MDNQMAGLKNKVVRLHILANSDSLEDQNIKLRIKEAILTELSPEIKKLPDAETTNSYIKNNLEKIKAIAENELKKLNKGFPVEVKLGKYEFPTKVYGDFTFPQGEYQALNIKIGHGEGKNWWCVMFPPLCFVDIAQNHGPNDSIEGLKKIFTEEEIEILKSENRGRSSVKLKFKIAEIYENLNMKIAKTLRKNI